DMDYNKYGCISSSNTCVYLRRSLNIVLSYSINDTMGTIVVMTMNTIIKANNTSMSVNPLLFDNVIFPTFTESENDMIFSFIRGNDHCSWLSNRSVRIK